MENYHPRESLHLDLNVAMHRLDKRKAGPSTIAGLLWRLMSAVHRLFIYWVILLEDGVEILGKQYNCSSLLDDGFSWSTSCHPHFVPPFGNVVLNLFFLQSFEFFHATRRISAAGYCRN